ncbi:MAG: hypothetical protein PHU98_08460 [Mariniphaga sp.]|nr:hypothetical protein [Mariniphaga sp.]
MPLCCGVQKGNRILFLLFCICLIVFFTSSANGQPLQPDTLLMEYDGAEEYDSFYDSLQYKARQKRITRLMYDFLVSPPRPYVDRKKVSLEYYGKMAGKIISGITINPLEVFGPSFDDTTRTAKSWVEKMANAIHSKSNLNTINKMLLFHVGEYLDPDILYENERLIRSLPYIQDVRFILEQDSLYAGLVKVHVLTKDRFSLGASGDVQGSSAAALEIYNQNIFGIGHEISFRFVGHLNRQPYMGLETFYKISNIRGKFIDISAGYMNTYRREGFSMVLDKPFITPMIRWGYGISALRMFRSDRVLANDPVQTITPLDFSYFSLWGGHSFQVKPNQSRNAQIVLSAGVNSYTFNQRPLSLFAENQYFSNSTFYLAGITYSQRRYIQDQLVYSYGITEDIPEGFKNELVYGLDNDEFGNRHYAHLFLSNGNLLVNRQGYLYFAGGIGGYYRKRNYEQGHVLGNLNFISRQISAGKKQFRLFLRANYLLGLHRFDIEQLNLNRDDHIRGFSSREAVGKQRLSVNLEYVLFLKKQLYKFNLAVYGFTDVGVIGSNSSFLFTQDYYSGLGLGMRVHNENLVFRTLHVRLGFYPYPPPDMSFTGLILEEQLKKSFYSFQPTPPQPFRFE